MSPRARLPRDRRSDADSGEGALIGSITPGAPAAVDGIERGDVITAIDGDAIASIDDMITSVDSDQPGDEVTIDLIRDGEAKQVTAQLDDRPTTAPS